MEADSGNLRFSLPASALQSGLGGSISFSSKDLERFAINRPVTHVSWCSFRTRLAFAFVGILALAGCAAPKPSTTEWPRTPSAHNTGPAPSNAPNSNPAVIVTPAQGTTGRITSINPVVRYVVISYAVGVPLPPVEQRLSVYRAGLKVAEVKISGPSRDTHTVGDIIAGECQVGDEVRGD